jgi:hypothetical protein
MRSIERRVQNRFSEKMAKVGAQANRAKMQGAKKRLLKVD